MQIAGAIVEFNPLHQGHLYFFRQIQAFHPDLTVLITSGYFSQRGLPSLLSPAQKTRLSLQIGADLVLQLPVLYTCQSADRFAKAAIQSLCAAGVNTLYFGSESNDLEFLNALAELLDDFQSNARKDQSMTRSLALLAEEKFGKELLSNDILGVHYCYWARKYNMKTISIQRSPAFASATSLRASILERQNWIYQSISIPNQNWDFYYPYLRYALCMSKPKSLSRMFLAEEGIENRLIRNAKLYENWNEFLEHSISRNYSRARIQRTCVFILLQVKKADIRDYPDFFMIDLLGMNARGRAYLKTLKDKKIISGSSQYPSYLYKIYEKTRLLYEWTSKTKAKKEIILLP